MLILIDKEFHRVDFIGNKIITNKQSSIFLSQTAGGKNFFDRNLKLSSLKYQESLSAYGIGRQIFQFFMAFEKIIFKK